MNHIDCWIFDLDNTLYPASCNLFDQVDQRIGAFIGDLLQVDAAEAKRLQKHYFSQYGTTLRGLMDHHGIAPGTFLDFVHAIDVSPVPPSPALDAALSALDGRKLIFTNGSVAHAERVMARLGVADHFTGVFDIVAANYQPKPNPASYAALIERRSARDDHHPGAHGVRMGRDRRARRPHPPRHRRPRRLARGRGSPAPGGGVRRLFIVMPGLGRWESGWRPLSRGIAPIVMPGLGPGIHEFLRAPRRRTQTRGWPGQARP